MASLVADGPQSVEMIRIKQLVADMHSIDMFEIHFFRAFESSEDDVFYHAEDSHRWQVLNQYIQYVDV